MFWDWLSTCTVYCLVSNNYICMYSNQWGDSPLTVSSIHVEVNWCEWYEWYKELHVGVQRLLYFHFSTELFCSYSWVDPLFRSFLIFTLTVQSVYRDYPRLCFVFYLCSVLCSNWQSVVNFASKHTCNLHHFFVLLNGFHMLKYITRWCSPCDYMFWAMAQKIFVP